MKMKKSNIMQLLLFSVFVLITACTIVNFEWKNGEEHVDATVTLTDVNGKVLRNKILFVEGYGIGRSEKVTDEKGLAHFDFYWNTYNESGAALWAIQAEEESNFKMVNLVFSPSGNNGTKSTIIDTIKMDSLRAFKIRVKVSRTDLIALNLAVKHEGMDTLPKIFSGGSAISGTQSSRGGYKVRQELKRVFLNHSQNTNTPQLDTTFQLNVYAHAYFDINCNVQFKTNPTSSNQKYTISETYPRDSIFLIQF